MDVRELIDRVRQQVNETVTVQKVFGEPYTVGEKTIIPVARVGFGFGAGGGRIRAESSDVPGGGGGGGGALPVGVVEITRGRTRFIPVHDVQRMAGAAVAGLVLGWWLGRRNS